MAELTAFGFTPGNSLLHRLDVRIKLACFFLISVSGLRARALALTALTLFCILVLRHIRLPLKTVFREIRIFLILLIFIFIAQALTGPGEPLIRIWKIGASAAGLHGGLLFCWRLLIVVLLGLAFTFSTRTAHIKAGVQWFLKPVPGLPERRVGTMLGLTVRFIPLVFEQAGRTADALKARGIDQRKNPADRLIKTVLPFMRKTFQQADDLAAAMEARCYSDRRTDPALTFTKADGAALALTVCFCAVFWLN